MALDHDDPEDHFGNDYLAVLSPEAPTSCVSLTDRDRSLQISIDQWAWKSFCTRPLMLSSKLDYFA